MEDLKIAFRGAQDALRAGRPGLACRIALLYLRVAWKAWRLGVAYDRASLLLLAQTVFINARAQWKRLRIVVRYHAEVFMIRVNYWRRRHRDGE